MFRAFTTKLAALALLSVSSLTAQATEEPLAPEIAFPASAKVQNTDSISVRFDIVEGYYLYHDKISVSTDNPDVAFGELKIPKGKVKQDEFFGEVETHRGKLATTLPITQRPAGATRLELKIKSQGCADIGLCYPPITQKVSVELPAQVATAAAATLLSGQSSSSFGSALDFSKLGASNDPIPDPVEAFKVELVQAGDGVISLNWNIHPATYLYKDKFAFELKDGSGTLAAATLPLGKKKHDEYFGEVETYRDTVQMQIPYSGDPSGAQLKIKYQGCADAGICYVPQQTELTLPGGLATAALSTAATNTAATTTAVAMTTTAVATTPALVSEQDRLTAQMRDNNFGLVLLGFFGLGLLLAFTPCVFPMIPILSGIIVGQGEDLSTRKALALSAVYVLAMALTYTIVGVLIGLSGENIQAWFQTPWVLYTFAAMFVALSFSMFGFYELQMPSAIQSKLTNMSNKQNGGDYAGVAIMGLLSALIVGPCVTAPLMAVLVYIAESGDAVKGGLVLFTLSLGMGAPLLLIGASAGKLLPRAGGWMDAVKAVFGVLMIAMAIWMLERVLPAPIILALSAMLLIVSAVYMGALSTPAEGKSGWYQLWRGLGIVFLIYGALLMVGATSGSKSLLKPLAGVRAVSTSGGIEAASDELHFTRVNSNAELDAAIANASAQGKSVMYDFYADWCASCKEMEAFTFTDPQVQAALGNFVTLQVDVTDNNQEHQAMLKRYGLFGPPAILFFNTNGQEQRNLRVVGFMESETFASNVRAVQ